MEGTESFAAYVERERARLHGERDAISNRQTELQRQLEAVDAEMRAIGAYEAAKSGRSMPGTRGNRGGGRGQSGARRGSKRDDLIRVIRESDGGMSRGEILEKMRLKGDKSGEMSVSNALTALTKSGQVRRENGKYTVAA